MRDHLSALAAKYNKKLGLLITAGVTTPQWVYAAGAHEFIVTTERGPRMYVHALALRSGFPSEME